MRRTKPEKDDAAQGTTEPIRVTLFGAVKTRPRTLNPVGTTPMLGRSIPVLVGDVDVGKAVTEHYPDVNSNTALFQAELNPALVPASWHGKEVPFAAVEQSRTWPGPFPIRILVAADAQPRFGVRSDNRR